MTRRQADPFCRLSTGGGFATRQLYENRGEELFYGQRPLVRNGIKDVTKSSDLKDRSLYLRLDHLRPDERITEQEL